MSDAFFSPGRADVSSAGGTISRNTASRRDAGAPRFHNQLQPRYARFFYVGDMLTGETSEALNGGVGFRF